MKKVFSKDIFLMKKVEEYARRMSDSYKWLDECDGKNIDELKVSEFNGFDIDEEYCLSEKEYNEIQEMKEFEEVFANTKDEAFIGSADDIVEMILKNNQTIVFDCKKVEEGRFKIDYKFVNFQGLKNESF